MSDFEKEVIEQNEISIEEKNLYLCPSMCDNIDTEDYCMKCIEGSNFKAKE